MGSIIANVRVLLVLAVIIISVCLRLNGQQPDSVTVIFYQGPNATGAGQPIPVGTFQVNGKQIASGIKDAVFSVRVPKGYKIAFCEEAVKDKLTACELFEEGIHNLKSFEFVRIQVWKEPVNQQVPPLTVFESANWLGRFQFYSPGMFRSDRNEFGKINDNMAMSIIVAKGFKARFCVDEGEWGRGAGGCEVHEEGRHNLRLADSISFIEVIDLSDRSLDGDTFPVVLFEDSGQGGKMQGFDVGTYLAGKGQFGKVLNDTASSITVRVGYSITICADEIPGDRCEERGPGKHNLKLKDSASYLKVVKQQ